MKKFILFVFLISCLFQHQNHSAKAETSFYAKIENSGVYFYSSPTQQGQLFEIPKSYFVFINSDANDFWNATYKNQKGFVKKEQVSLMNGHPQNPYANSSFKVFVTFPLYDQPNQNSQSKISITPNQTLTYYGTKIGQSLSSTNSVWYYCSTFANNQEIFGYVFSGVVDQAPQIHINYETFAKVEDETFSNSQSNEYSSLSTKTKIMLVVAISVPSAMIFYFLIKPSRIAKSASKQKKTRVYRRKPQHSDYYEFDENDL